MAVINLTEPLPNFLSKPCFDISTESSAKSWHIFSRLQYGLEILLKQIVLRNMKCIRQTYTGYRLNWLPKCRALDISWMSCCVFCGDFMRLRSYSFKNEKLDLEKACKQVNRLGYNYGGNI